MTTNPATPTTPASANFEKLKAKLRELFELDKADLDFGIYRILRARHQEISEFLDKHLEKTVREALQSHGNLRQAQVEEDLRKAEQTAKDAGIAPEQSPRVLEIREKLKSGNDLDALADEVYSHLYTFFSRYYQEGDFLGLHRSTVHGREKYMIPYNGEEVKLVWANMDQYYIKSSELLRDYTFQITPGQGTLLEAAASERLTVHFKLVEADTEKDNRKPNGKATRAFALDNECPFIESSSLAPIGGELARGLGQGEGESNTLTIRFRYREHSAERSLQDKLNADTVKSLADNLPNKWKAVLFAPDLTYQGKDKKDTRSILQKHLRSYTAKHQFDYFIHKDLGGFLRRELDFYIKNEVMYLDDIENASAPKAEEYLSKIRALRRCAVPVIGMLEQLENFQKKLWLKKKFVVETRYCMTFDRVPEALYPEIAANVAQREEWVKLYAIDEIKKDLAQPGYSEPLTVEFLKANPYLMLDTRHFGRDFTLKLLSAIENLDESLDGICFHSENFQALQLMQERYREQVKCVYIDPPYNTGSDGFAYRDGYQHSSWIAAMGQSVAISNLLLRRDAGFFSSIDDNEVENLKFVLREQLRPTDFLAHIVWQKRYAPDIRTAISDAHEHVLAFTKCYDEFKAGRIKLPLTEKQRSQFSNPDSDPRGSWKADNFTAQGFRPNQMYEVILPSGRKVRPPQGRCWVTTEDKFKALLAAGRIYFAKDGDGLPAVKRYLAEMHGMVPWTWWEHSEVGHSQQGMKVTMDLFGREGTFLTAKPPKLIERILFISATANYTCLDYFAGSGTTGHAAINLNREDDGNRKYLLVEMGEYFDTVLVPRLKKVVYSTDWKDSKPQTCNTGISHAFKIVRLESYEDTLNNLRLKRTPEQEAALKTVPEKARDQYLLGYFLDVESAGSASLLDLDQFRNPFAYQLKIAISSAGETVDTTIDLVETFNWLLGLKVKHIDMQRGFLTVTGEKRAGGRMLVIWRTLSDDPIADNQALEAFLAKLAVNPADTEFDYIYVNGSHTLTDPHNKVHLIEEAFQRLMFDGGNFESLE